MISLIACIPSPYCLLRNYSFFAVKQYLSYAVLTKFPSHKYKSIKYGYLLAYPMLSTSKLHLDQNQESNLDFKDNFDNCERTALLNSMLVYEDFLNPDEEKSIFDEIEPYMKRLRYEFDHWDDAIHGFRETERLKWNIENTKIIDKVRSIAFPPGVGQLQHVHVLDLSSDGHIKPHIDSARFCGNVIAGLSLLSDSVMRLVHDKDKSKVLDVLLKQRSLYIMRDIARYDYTHEILPNSISKYKNLTVNRTRRISVICRNEPNQNRL